MAYRKGQSGGLSPATRITQEIIARLEAGTKPWIKPWRGVPVSRPLRACGIPYRGMNVFWLWMVADMCGYASSPSARQAVVCLRSSGSTPRVGVTCGNSTLPMSPVATEIETAGGGACPTTSST